MKPSLIQFDESTRLSAQVLHDLDAAKLLRRADESLSEEETHRWLMRYFCADAAEISARSAVLADLSDTDPAVFETALGALRAVTEEEEKYGRSLTRLDEVLYLTRRDERFIEAVDGFCAILDKSVTSERLGALKAFFEALRGKSAAIREALDAVHGMIRLPRNLYLGVNVREDGTPQEYSLVGQSFEEENPNSLLCARRHEERANSLSAEFSYNSRLYGFHFDEYINRTLEKRFKSVLPKARKLLLNAALPDFESFQALAEPLSWCLLGLKLRDLFLRTRAPFCRPEPLQPGESPALLEASDLHYPDLLVSLPDARGNETVLNQRDIYLVTGANHSGKTSYLKTVGQSLLLAQLGFGVPAVSFRFTPVKGLYTLFSAGEDDSMDASRMGIEINRISEITENARPGDLVLFNEPLTSTNPLEAVSICADISRSFLDRGIPLLLVTHLYDVYFLLRAALPEEQQARLHSLITESRYDEAAGAMVHAFRLREAEPEGNSYARETAGAYGITVDAMLPEEKRREALRYLNGLSKVSFYEGGKQ